MRPYVLAVTAAVAAVMSFAGPAAAAPDRPPVSGDARATAYSGNVVEADCGTLFPGTSMIAEGDLRLSKDDTYIDITHVAAGVNLAGVVVKGGPAYNVYKPGDLGELPWLKLHAPLVPSGGPAGISHWFACGTGHSTTTTSEAPPVTTTTTSPGSTETTETSTPPGSETDTTTTDESDTAGASVTTTAPTTSADVSATAQDENLASTGFNGGWLFAIAGLLLAGGAALLLLVRLRAARR